MDNVYGNNNPQKRSDRVEEHKVKGYLKTMRWETSKDCQYSSGTKLL